MNESKFVFWIIRLLLSITILIISAMNHNIFLFSLSGILVLSIYLSALSWFRFKIEEEKINKCTASWCATNNNGTGYYCTNCLINKRK